MELKRIMVFFLTFLSTYCAAQSEKESYTPRANHFFIGLDFGGSALLSKFMYNTNEYAELDSQRKYSNQNRINIRLALGYQFNYKHRFDLSLQNLAIKTGYTINYSENTTLSSQLIKGGTYLSAGYTYEPIRYKRVSFNLGPHFGIGIAGNSDYGSDDAAYTSETNSSGQLIYVLYHERHEVRHHQVFVNFGGRLNVLIALGKKSELFFNTSILYTPYSVRGFDFLYSLNSEPLKSAQSSSNILTYTFGLGYNYKFVKK